MAPHRKGPRVLAPADIWRRVWLSRPGVGCRWHLVGGGGASTKHATVHRTAPQQTMTWPQMSVVLRVRNWSQWFTPQSTAGLSPSTTQRTAGSPRLRVNPSHALLPTQGTNNQSVGALLPNPATCPLLAPLSCWWQRSGPPGHSPDARWSSPLEPTPVVGADRAGDSAVPWPWEEGLGGQPYWQPTSHNEDALRPPASRHHHADPTLYGNAEGVLRT